MSALKILRVALSENLVFPSKSIDCSSFLDLERKLSEEPIGTDFEQHDFYENPIFK
jgi:hypothetical protein